MTRALGRRELLAPVQPGVGAGYRRRLSCRMQLVFAIVSNGTGEQHVACPAVALAKEEARTATEGGGTGLLAS